MSTLRPARFLSCALFSVVMCVGAVVQTTAADVRIPPATIRLLDAPADSPRQAPQPGRIWTGQFEIIPIDARATQHENFTIGKTAVRDLAGAVPGKIEVGVVGVDGAVPIRIDRTPLPATAARSAGTIISVQMVPIGPESSITIHLNVDGLEHPITIPIDPYFSVPAPLKSSMPEGNSVDGPAYAGGQTYHFTGRVEYVRPAVAGNQAGMTFPEALFPADGLLFEIRDSDPIFDETIASGTLDANGEFDVTVFWDDGSDDPDLYLYFETENAAAFVQNTAQVEYSWESAQTPNFQGTELDFGLQIIEADAPAAHIHSVVTRARRHIIDETGYATDSVDVNWPSPFTDSAFYFFGTIDMSNDRQWFEDTICHEWGHFFESEIDSINDPMYCNDICDGTPPLGCGHCRSCPENPRAAWQEGFANFISRISTDWIGEEYPDYDLAYIRDIEPNVYTCDPDGIAGNGDEYQGNVVITEGPVGALLYDLRDTVNEDNTGTPSLCDGYDDANYALGSILNLIAGGGDIDSINDFINTARQDDPGVFDSRLYRTALQVGYAASLWPDVEGPEVVFSVESDTHPMGSGGSFAEMMVTVGDARDDATGTNAYAITWTASPSDPGENVTVENTRVAVSPPLDLGEWYVNVRARDCAGNWSNDFASFGPFEVIDCNNNGLHDSCEIDANCTSTYGFCDAGDCAVSQDCNSNGIPDDCDLQSGVSVDCDQDGILDECQPGTCIRWTGLGDDTTWSDPLNWENDTVPTGLNRALILSGGPTIVIDVPADLRSIYSSRPMRIEAATDVAYGYFFGAEPLDVDAELEIVFEGEMTALDLESGGSLIGQADVLVYQASTWSGGHIMGGGNLVFREQLNAIQAGGVFLIGKTIVIQDEMIWGGAIFEPFGMSVQDNGGIIIAEGAVMNIVDDKDIVCPSGEGFIEVLGTLVKTGITTSPDNTSTIGTPMTIRGDIELQNGNIRLPVSAASNLIQSGRIHTFAGTELVIEAPLTTQSNTEITSDGRIVWTGMTDSNINGLYDVEETLVDGPDAALSLRGEIGMLGLLETQNDATARVFGTAPAGIDTIHNGAVFVAQDASGTLLVETLIQDGNLLNVQSRLDVQTLATWGRGTIDGPGDVVFSGAGEIQLYQESVLRSGGLLRIAGSTSVLSESDTFRLTLDSQTELRVDVESSLALRDNADITDEGSGALVTNHGLIQKLDGGDTSLLDCTLHNTGEIRSSSGTFAIGQDGTVNDGTYRAETGARLEMHGSHDVNVAGDLKGTGTVSCVGIEDDVVDIMGSIQSLARFEVDGAGRGIVRGPVSALGRAQATGGTMEWAIETTSGVGALFIEGGIVEVTQPLTCDTMSFTIGTLAGPADLTVNIAAEFLGGRMLGSGNTISHGSLSVVPEDTTEIRGRRLVGTGDVLVSTPNGIALALVEQGVLEFAIGSQVEFRSPIFATGSANALVRNRGTVSLTGGGNDLTFEIPFVNDGSLGAGPGETIRWVGPYTQNGGKTTLDGGLLRFDGDAQINGGILTGTTAATGFVMVDGGTIVPSDPTIGAGDVGRLVHEGDLIMQSGAAYDVTINGFDPDVEHDQLFVTGTYVVGGTLAPNPASTFVLNPGDEFVIAEASSVTGDFDSIAGTPGAGMAWDVLVDDSLVVLRVVESTGIDEDLDGDGIVGFGDLIALLSAFGPCPGPGSPCDADFNGDGSVDFNDLLAILAAWGQTSGSGAEHGGG